VLKFDGFDHGFGRDVFNHPFERFKKQVFHKNKGHRSFSFKDAR
jgi:hypothetical protein